MNPVVIRPPSELSSIGASGGAPLTRRHLEIRTDPQADRQGRRGGDQGTDSVVEVAPDGTVTVLRTVEVSR